MAITTAEFIQECRFVYDALLSETEDETEERFWEGSITKWFQSKNISTDKYSRIMHALKAMQCIETVTSGNRYVPSVIQLLRPPSVELWVAASTDGKFIRHGQKKMTAQEQLMHSYADRIKKLEDQVAILMEERLVESTTS